MNKTEVSVRCRLLPLYMSAGTQITVLLPFFTFIKNAMFESETFQIAS